jgi:hypothetical protein
MLMRRDAEAAKTGKDKGGFEEPAGIGKQDDAEKTSDGSLKSGDPTETKAEVKSKAEDVAPSDVKTPADADATKSNAKTPDAEKTDASETEKTNASEAEKTKSAETTHLSRWNRQKRFLPMQRRRASKLL